MDGKLKSVFNDGFLLLVIFHLCSVSSAEESAYDSLLKKYDQKINSGSSDPKTEPLPIGQKADKNTHESTDHPIEKIKNQKKKIKNKNLKKSILSTTSQQGQPNVTLDASQTPPTSFDPVNSKISSDQNHTSKPDIKEQAPQEKESSPALFGDWKGLKTISADHGFDFSVGYKADYYKFLTGPEEEESGLLGNLDLTIDFSLEKLMGLKGLQLYFYGLGNHGDRPSEKFGDSFVSSNIEAPTTFKIYEAYFRKSIDDDKFSILLGLRDLNADFYALESSGYFINSSFGISPSLSQTGVNGPSIFPVAAPAITTKFDSKDGFYFQTGFFNATAGDPDNQKGTHIPMNLKNGSLLIIETGLESVSFFKKLSLGIWQYSKPFESIDSSVEPTNENYGQYAMFDISLNENSSYFLKLGNAAPKVNTFFQSFETGFTISNFLQLRPQDTFFIGYTHANASDDYIRINNSEKFEAVIEVGYKAMIAEGFWITPDYQEVINPGLAGSSKKGSIFILRTNLIF